MSVRAWRKELGLPIVDAYLAFAPFHVWLELVLFSFLFARRFS